MKIDDLVRRVDELAEQGRAVLQTVRNNDIGFPSQVDSGKYAGFRAASLSLLERIYGSDHTQYKEFSNAVDSNFATRIECGLEILSAVRSEISGGWLFTVKGLVAAELFADFVEMSEHLLTSGYKDPAAVLIGSVLEEHLRHLCQRHNLQIEETKNGRQIPLKADRLNSDLSKANVYTKLDMKNVTAWLDLRNNAAHGKYDAYVADQVTHMISGISSFISRVTIS